MIHHDVEQGSDAWLALHIGILTASEFDQIVTPAGKLSGSARKLMARLLAERLLNENLGIDISHVEHVRRGKEQEPEAARIFSATTGRFTKVVGFITTDDGRWGASPDRMIPAENACLEIKCPSPMVHALYRIDGFGDAYKAQAQGQILIAEADKCVRYSHNQRMPQVICETPRDEPFIMLMTGHLNRFSDELDMHTEKLRAEGFFEDRKRAVGVADLVYADPDDIEAIIGSYGDGKKIHAG